jgi:hypothetical protein
MKNYLLLISLLLFLHQGIKGQYTQVDLSLSYGAVSANSGFLDQKRYEWYQSFIEEQRSLQLGFQALFISEKDASKAWGFRVNYRRLSGELEDISSLQWTQELSYQLQNWRQQFLGIGPSFQKSRLLNDRLLGSIGIDLLYSLSLERSERRRYLVSGEWSPSYDYDHAFNWRASTLSIALNPALSFRLPFDFEEESTALKVGFRTEAAWFLSEQSRGVARLFFGFDLSLQWGAFEAFSPKLDRYEI